MTTDTTQSSQTSWIASLYLYVCLPVTKSKMLTPTLWREKSVHGKTRYFSILAQQALGMDVKLVSLFEFVFVSLVELQINQVSVFTAGLTQMI